MNYTDAEFQNQLTEWRRDFHHYAEAKWTEFRTAAIAAAHLKKLGIPVVMGEDLMVRDMGFSVPPMDQRKQHMERAVSQGADRELVEAQQGLAGVMGIFDTGVPGPVTAFRFDIDSLPFSETKDPDHRPNREGFASVNEGACHACGHDGHTAIGMGLAEWLVQHKSELKGKIKLIFQPSEEGGGGARGIVAKGHLDDVQYCFVGHLGLTQLDGTPVLSNQLVAGCKDFLGNVRYNITYKGTAAHPCGDPQKGHNAILSASLAALGIHSIAPHGGGMFRVNVGKISGGLSRNAIAPNSYLELECRGNTEEIMDYGEKRVLECVKAAGDMYGCETFCELVGKTASGAADDRAIGIVLECAKEVPWFKDIRPEGSVGGSDDAIEMIRRVQEHGGAGTYVGLGTDFTTSFHDQAFDFDENVLMASLELFERITAKIHG